MSADAALLPCPICAHVGVFDSAQSLRDRLIHVSTDKLSCPVCQEEICGLDKLTIHLFSHVKILSNHQPKDKMDISSAEVPRAQKSDSNIVQKQPRPTPKNKTSPTTATAPMKYVKIYPKLPVISLNPVPIIEISQKNDKCTTNNETVYIATTEAHTPPSDTTCNICGLQFVDTNILRMHRYLIHNIEDPSSQTSTRYNCHLCPKNFKMRGSLMVHLRVAHFGFLSSISNAESQSNQKGQHLNSEDSDKASNIDKNDNKQWQCEVCRKYFTTKYFLKKHKRLHTGETPYACAQCNKTFTFQQSYHKHLLYHNDEKPHTCSYCGRSFKELSTLHNHQRIHTGEKPFACETCGKCFRQRVSYLVHRRIHTGVMPYKCTACDKSFRYKVSQRTHKCLAQPPGTVVRQSGDLVEKLKKKHTDEENLPDMKEEVDAKVQNISFNDVSEANVELVRTGAQLSLEDMESENFRIISEPFMSDITSVLDNSTQHNETALPSQKLNIVFNTNIEELINNIPVDDKDVPSPSEILKNLCLNQEEDLNIL